MQRDLNMGDQSFYRFFIAQINLLAAMCRGNNIKVIEALQSTTELTFGVKIDFELVMGAIIDCKLRMSQPQLVATLIELLKGLFR